MKRPGGAPAPEARRERGGRGARLLIAGIAAAVAIVVWRGALGYWFSQDDFAYLGRARGVLPPIPSPWRWLTNTGYFVAMKPFGLESALPYHLASVAAYSGCAAALATLLSRRFPPAAALAGAVFFAAHPAAFTAVYSAATIGDSLALLGVLLALLALGRRGRARWLAVPLYAAALLFKESVLLLPLVAMIRPGWCDRPGPDDESPGPRRRFDPVMAGLILVALAMIAAIAAHDVYGARPSSGAPAAYAFRLGPHVAGNLSSYLGWTIDLFVPGPHGIEDALDPASLPWAVGLAAAWLAGLAWRRLHERGWLAGGATWLAFALPVLPLEHHTYRYYLVAPLAGAAWCVAAALWAALAPAAEPRLAAGRAPARARPAATAAALTIVATLFAIAFALGGAGRVQEIETMPFWNPALRANPTVDRARIARRLVDGLRAANLPAGTRLVLWSPSSEIFERRTRPGIRVVPGDTYWDRSVRAAVLDGVAIRLMLPQLAAVEFARAEPAAQPGRRTALYDPDGTVRVLAAAPGR
jgi:hypothetical protein